MSGIEWAAGEHHALVLDRVVLLVSPEVGADAVRSLWSRLLDADELGLGTVLELLGAATGTKLSSLPHFAVALRDGRRLHVAVRGNHSVVVAGTDGTSDELRGADVSTWLERNVDVGATSYVVLGTGGQLSPWWPLERGVVPAGQVRLTLADVAVPDVPPLVTPPASVETLAEVEPEPAVDPEPAVEPAVEPEDQPVPDGSADEAPAAEQEPEKSSRFAHLFSSHTVLHDIEDAAVRLDADERESESEAAPVPDPSGGEASVLEAERPAGEPAHEPAKEPVGQATGDPAPVPPVAASFISGVPPAAPPMPPVGTSRPGLVVTTAAGGSAEHHDGHTMMEVPDSAEVDAHVRSADAAAGMTVLGVLCPAGHGNPVHRTACRVCGQPLQADAVRMARPGLGWLHTSAGESIELVQDVLAGRNPQAARIQGTVLPRLLLLPHNHVSATHLAIRLEGWSVMAVDLDSTNGTFLQRPGQPTVRLSRTPQLLMSGDVVQLNHGVDLRFEALP